MPNPSKYRDEFPEQAKKLCMLLGATNAKLAGFFDVHESSIDRWLAEKPEFAEAVRFGKDIADSEVAFSTYQRAVGYSHPETKVHFYTDAKGDVQVKTVEVIKHYPPDTGAAAFWLKNRQGWRDKVDLVGAGPMELVVRYEDDEKKPVDETPAADPDA